MFLGHKKQCKKNKNYSNIDVFNKKNYQKKLKREMKCLNNKNKNKNRKNLRKNKGYWNSRKRKTRCN